MGLAIRKSKNWTWGWRCLNTKQRRQQKIQEQRKRENVWRQRPLGRAKNQIRGNHQEMWYKIWMLRQWFNWGWVLDGSFWSEETLDHIVLLAGLYRISWIGSYRIGWIVSGYTGFYALSGYWLNGLDGTDGLDGTLVGQGWDGTTLAGAGTGAPPLDLEGQRAVVSGYWHQFCRCFKGAEYLCQRRKIIQIDCTQIRINT